MKEDRYAKLRMKTVLVCTFICAVVTLCGATLFYTGFRELEGFRRLIYWRFIFGISLIGNAASLIAMWFSIGSPNLKLRTKNMVLTHGMLFICFFSITPFQHFPGGFAMYGVPVLFSAIFADPKISRMTAVNALLFNFLSLGAGLFFNEPYCSVDPYINYGISSICVIICCILSVLFFQAYRDNLVALNAGKETNSSLELRLERDPMTGLYNHSAFYTHLDRLVKERNEEPLSLAVIDIDNFKHVNDTFGHNNGDEVILRLTQVLKEHIGEENYICRYGGEEFAVIFPNQKSSEAKVIMDAVLTDFRTQKYDWLEGVVTFSCGIFQLSAYRMSSAEFFRVADKMLYQAKHSGKNQCISG